MSSNVDYNLRPDYDKVIKYMYSNVITIKPPDPPTIVYLTTNDCICVDKIDNLVKTKEAENAKLLARIKARRKKSK